LNVPKIPVHSAIQVAIDDEPEGPTVCLSHVVGLAFKKLQAMKHIEVAVNAGGEKFLVRLKGVSRIRIPIEMWKDTMKDFPFDPPFEKLLPESV